MSRLLNRADEKLRTALLAPLPRFVCVLLHAVVIACFALLMLMKNLVLLSGAALSARIACVLMLCLLLALMLRFARQAGESRRMGLMGHALLAAVCAAAMLARVSFIEHVSGDYEIYLANWMDKFRAVSFAEGMRQSIGEYNVLYQYILFLITRLPVPALYAVKTASFMGDALLAGACARLAGKGKKQSALALCAVLLLPVCVLNGGMFAQCDSLYAACALWGLALALDGKHTMSAVSFALSLAFKLQAVFILPVVAILWSARKLRLEDALTFIVTLAATALPALIGGKSVSQILSIYIGQTGLYNGLTYNAPGFFGLMNTNGLDVYAYGNFGMALALGALCALLAYAMPRAEKMDDDDYVRTSLIMVLMVVFLLPRMHERYFYLADILVVALACRDRRAVLPAGLIALASVSRLWDMGIPLAAASMMMLAAIALLLSQAKDACEKETTCV